MKKYILLSTVFLFAVLGLILSASSNADKKPVVPTSNKSSGIVVMELFTSQGCSSCPAADALLAKYALQDEPGIFPLSFHVDYWNRLGWKDPFSDPAYSKRQRDYALVIDGATVYTPQLIVNGQKEMIGSNAIAVSNAVKNGLQSQPVVQLSISKIITAADKIIVSYSTDVLPKNIKLNAALVQPKTTTNILRGENHGIQLDNYNVVRSFSSQQLIATSSEISLIIPPGNIITGWQLVLYAQEDASAKIIGATKKGL